jgi:ATP/maltotriose-dependent transcriptional regulator MalT
MVAKSSRSLHAEHLAWRSLAHAISGHKHEARDMADRANSMSHRIDVAGLVPWVHAILALGTSRELGTVNVAFCNSIEDGNVDAFVTAYRACPQLLELVASDSNQREYLETILERAHDHILAEQVGIHLAASAETNRLGNLSKRELEVLDLVCQGLMNKEIGRTLYITEATAKAHVRKICKKLGVRSRTEAAMRASELSG